jgi:uncharacterized membrane protein
MTSLWLATSFWLALHLLVAGGPLRVVLSARLGERGYLVVFSLLSTLALVWLILAYRAAPWVPLWPTVPGLGYLALLLVLLAFAFNVFGGAPRTLMSACADRFLGQRLPVYGITRITRHPRLFGVALWAIAHLLVNGNLAALLLFGVIFVTALTGMASIDRKRRRAFGAIWDEFAAQTSRLPFIAILAGRTRLELRELAAWRLVLAVVLFAGVAWIHGMLGPSPIVAIET